MNKSQVKSALEASRQDFLAAVEGLSEEALHEPGVIGDWSIKDLMSHMSAWEAELVKLLWQAQEGQKPTSVHFRKVNVDEQNAAWHQEYQLRPLDRVTADFQGVRKQTLRRLEGFSDADLEDPQRWPWLRREPLWKWIENDSFGHEAEHTAEIRSWRSAHAL